MVSHYELQATITSAPEVLLAVERVAYGGWHNCYRLSDGAVELIVTTDVGPRIIRYGFVDGPNLFWENSYQLGKSGEEYWQIRGGHRLWVAPEIVLVTYALDNGPIEARVTDNAIAVVQRAPIEKEMLITLGEDGNIEVIHKVRNCGLESVQLAAWAVTVMAQGGIGVAALPEPSADHSHLLPTHSLVLWPYTDLSDPRWTFSSKYILLRHDASMPRAQKLGLFNKRTFGAYLVGSDLFVKQSEAATSTVYPDFNCSFEMFTNNDFLELETLGPLVKLEPGEATTHVERWSLHRNVRFEHLNDTELNRMLRPLMK